MQKSLLLLGLFVLSSPLSAAQCFYYWSADCFDIRDALKRDITHHVFLSEQVRTIELKGDSCDAETFASEHPEMISSATARINSALNRVKSCNVLEQAEPKVFDREADAFSQWQQLSSEQQFKRLRWLKKLP